VKKKEKEEKMSFTVKGRCQHGELTHRRKTPEAALKRRHGSLGEPGCYDVHIVTPEGRDYASSEFGDLPRSPAGRQAIGQAVAGASENSATGFCPGNCLAESAPGRNRLTHKRVAFVARASTAKAHVEDQHA
jgi:hypothetical protein